MQITITEIVDFVISYKFSHANEVNTHNGGVVHAPAMNVEYTFVEQFKSRILQVMYVNISLSP